MLKIKMMKVKMKVKIKKIPPVNSVVELQAHLSMKDINLRNRIFASLKIQRDRINTGRGTSEKLG